MKESELRTAHLISGSGSTVRAIILESQTGRLKGKVKPVVVISDRFDAAGIYRTRDLGVRSFVIPRRELKRSIFGKTIMEVCKELGVDNILQNGWLAYTPEEVIARYEGAIFNQHPGPLDPDNAPLHFGGQGMYGLRVHAAVLKFQELAKRKFPTEATVHIVTPEFDSGEVVLRSEVKVEEGDTPESLAHRVLPVEHESHIVFLNLLHEGKVEIQRREGNLIKPGEERILYEAKRHAIKIYP